MSPLRTLLRRTALMRRSLLAVSALSAALLTVGSASAQAACTNAGSGVISQFCSQPASTTAGSDPNVVTTINLTYANGTDTVKDLTVSLPPGLLASPAAVPSTCSSSQLSSFACPAGSQIGTGAFAATGGINGTTALYLMPPPNANADVTGLGLIISVLGTPVVSATGTVDVASVAGQPVLKMAFTNLPNQIVISGNPVPVQVTGLTLTINGTAPTAQGGTSTTPFIRLPTSCALAATTVSVDTYNANSNGAGTDSFTPTGCSGLPYAPKLTGSATKDTSDAGVALTTTLTQHAGEAGNKTVALTIPSTALAPNLIAAGALLNSSTPVGTATASSPLLASPLTGHVFLTGSLTSPALTVTFPAPFALSFSGAISLANSSVTFANVPDVPLNSLTVTLTAGQNALFTTTCSSPTTALSGAFTGQNGASVTSSTPVTIAGCSSGGGGGGGGTKGKPTSSATGLSGLASGKPKLSFKLKAGTKAPKIRSFTLSLPKGLSFISKTLHKGVSVSGAKVKSVQLRGGKLVITLKTPVSSLKLALSRKALKVSAAVIKKVKHHKVRSLKGAVTVKDASGKSTTLSIVFARLS